MTTTDLAARYGTPAPWRRRLLLGTVATVVLAFGGWLTWVTVVQADPSVASGNLVYDASAPTTTNQQIIASFDIDMADDVTEATCTLEAQARDHVTVGYLSFVVPAGTTRVEQPIATERRAAHVELLGCTAPGQGRPR